MKKIRKLSRLGNELHLTASMAILDWVPGNHDQAVVALLVLGRCADDWCDGDAIRRPERLERTISIRAAARSLHAANATIQRHVANLVERGVLVELPGGIAVNNAPGSAGAVIATLTTAHDSFLRLVEDVEADVGFPSPQQPARGLTKAILAQRWTRGWCRSRWRAAASSTGPAASSGWRSSLPMSVTSPSIRN